jgi:hypothetical protein
MKPSEPKTKYDLHLISSALRPNYKILQSHFLGSNRLFQRKLLENLNFEIFCVGKKLTGFQKPLFGTPDITLFHPQSSVLGVVHIIRNALGGEGGQQFVTNIEICRVLRYEGGGGV